MSPGNKNVPPVLSSDCRLVVRKQTPCSSTRGPRAGSFLRVLFPSLLPHLYSRPRSNHRERANHISMTSSVQKRARACGGLAKPRDSQSAMWRGTRTGRIYSRGDKAPAVPRCCASLSPSSSSPASRLLLPILLPSPLLLLLRSFFFFFFFLFDAAASSSAGPYPLRSFWYRAASIWKHVPIVRRADLLPASTCRKLLRLFVKKYSRYLFRQDSSMSSILEILVTVQSGHCKLDIEFWHTS